MQLKVILLNKTQQKEHFGQLFFPQVGQIQTEHRTSEIVKLFKYLNFYNLSSKFTLKHAA